MAREKGHLDNWTSTKVLPADCRYANLEDKACSCINARGVDFSFANLQGLSLFTSDLTGAKFFWTNLKDARFFDSKLFKTILEQETKEPTMPGGRPSTGPLPLSDGEAYSLATYRNAPVLFHLSGVTNPTTQAGCALPCGCVKYDYVTSSGEITWHSELKPCPDHRAVERTE